MVKTSTKQAPINKLNPVTNGEVSDQTPPIRGGV